MVRVAVFEGEECELLVPAGAEIVGDAEGAAGTEPLQREAAGAGGERESRLLFHAASAATLAVRFAGGEVSLGAWRSRGGIEARPGRPAGARGASGFLGIRDGRRERSFRGSLSFEPGPGRPRVVNLLSLEEYVVGVVASEMPLSYPLEALKAQAIAARTFALYELLWARDHGDHGGERVLASDTSFQAYAGVRDGEERAARAVLETVGAIVVYRDALFRSYYHSTCGGSTAPARAVFGDAAIPPLGGGSCGACGESRFARWSVRLAAAEIEASLAEWVEHRGGRLDGIRELEVAEVDESGRARYVLVRHEGEAFAISAERLRALLAAAGSPLRSSAFRVRRDEEAFVFEGEGFGHRVGLCQVGAGRRGAREDHRAILAHYYPESRIARLEDFY
jgi:stage II sporulation protein D